MSNGSFLETVMVAPFVRYLVLWFATRTPAEGNTDWVTLCVYMGCGVCVYMTIKNAFKRRKVDS